MSWAGEFRAIGFYKLTDSQGRVWRLDHRKRSRTEREGYYLYGPDGVDVVAEWMGVQRVGAQRKAEIFVDAYDAHGDMERAESDRKDEEWQRLIENA